MRGTDDCHLDKRIGHFKRFPILKLTCGREETRSHITHKARHGEAANAAIACNAVTSFYACATQSVRD